MSEFNIFNNNRWGDLGGLPTAPHDSIDDELSNFMGFSSLNDDDSDDVNDDVNDDNIEE